MLAVNHFHLIGTCADLPERFTTKSGKMYAKFHVDLPSWSNGAQGNERFEVLCFGNTAHEAMQILKPGRTVAVEGQLRSQSNMGRSGGIYYNLSMSASRVTVDEESVATATGASSATDLQTGRMNYRPNQNGSRNGSYGLQTDGVEFDTGIDLNLGDESLPF